MTATLTDTAAARQRLIAYVERLPDEEVIAGADVVAGRDTAHVVHPVQNNVQRPPSRRPSAYPTVAR